MILVKWFFNSNRDKRAESLIQKFKMGKISKFLLNSLLATSVYGNEFSVRSCNDDSDVSIKQLPNNTHDTVETKKFTQISYWFNQFWDSIIFGFHETPPPWYHGANEIMGSPSCPYFNFSWLLWILLNKWSWGLSFR